MLIGLGLGPGDKELLTLRAVRLLQSADKVFVPGRIAKELVEDYCEPEILEFPMVENDQEVEAAMQRNADRIAIVAMTGTAVLGILGDPSFYSTFWRLCDVSAKRYPDMEFRVEPGISSITACASRMGVSVNHGFVVTDGPDPDTLILLKVRKPKEKVRELMERGFRHFVLAERLYMTGERIYKEPDIPETSDYFSIMIARR